MYMNQNTSTPGQNASLRFSITGQLIYLSTLSARNLWCTHFPSRNARPAPFLATCIWIAWNPFKT